MRQEDETMLTSALKAMRSTEPDAAELSASARRVADRLHLEAPDPLAVNAGMGVISNCKDVQQQLNAYRTGSLSPSRSLLIEAHLHDCGACLRQFRSASGTSAVDWSAPGRSGSPASRPARNSWLPNWLPAANGWGLAPVFSLPVLALLVSAFFVYKAYWQVPPGVRAEVQSIDGSAYRISDAGDRQLSPGDKLAEGDRLRTSGGAHAVLRLSDGSTVEVKERSVLALGARGHNMTLSLDNGAVIVEAAKRQSGHLYVKTADCRVAVTGTVFSVNSGMKGSRVAVLQGAVEVTHAGIDTVVGAGDQLATNDNLSPEPVEQQIAWSHDRGRYLALLAQLFTLQHRLEQVQFPQSRYTSDLLGRVPADTLFYVSIPNLGEFMTEANSIFQDQLKQSPVLQQWWNHGHDRNTAELDSLVKKLHDMSQYLGDEVVIVGFKQSNNSSFAILADVQRAGLDDYLRRQFPQSTSSAGLIVLDQNALNSYAGSQPAMGEFALIGSHEVVFSNSIATLKQMNAQLTAGPSGFTTSDFGQQIAAAYSRGAGIILAADLHQMMAGNFNSPRAGSNEFADQSGMKDLHYLIAEHRETNGQPENHLNLQFSGTRQRVASWLAAPAPIGSLDFITPNAAVAVALLTKDPSSIADDILSMAAPHGGAADLSRAEQELHINLRDDIAANLGGDFLLSLDGPVLPIPSWKAVVEIHNPDRIEQTMERLAQASQSNSNQTGQGHDRQEHAVKIESSEISGQRFYSIVEAGTGKVVAQYTFADGYMVLAPTRALLMEALHTHSSGDSLAHSAAFKALLPKDENENYSAIAYQNLSPVLTPLLSQFSGKQAEAIRQLAADARPTAICAWGRDTRIEAASNSRLLGFDFLTFGALMDHGDHGIEDGQANHGNQHAPAHVTN